MNRLIFSFDPSNEPDDLSLLSVSIATTEFSGRARTWACPEAFEEFAKALTAYPIPNDPPAEFRIGFGSNEGEEVRICVRVSPADRRGTLGVQVDLSDYLDLESRLRTHFTTHYRELERFQRQLALMAKGATTEAVLEGS